MFEFGSPGYRSLVTDEELLACLSTRGPLKCPEDGIMCVVLNAGGTDRVCHRVQSECGVPTVLGWGDHDVPGSLCVAMVCRCVCRFESSRAPPPLCAQTSHVHQFVRPLLLTMGAVRCGSLVVGRMLSAFGLC